jgi:tape measure domain-containing protein
MAEVLVRFRIHGNDVDLEKIGHTAEGVERKLRDAGRAGKGAGEDIGAGAKSGVSGLTTLINPLSVVGGLVTGLVAAKFSQWAEASGRAVAQFGMLALTTADNFKQLQVQLGSLRGGDIAAASKDFAWIKQFALDTPQELEQVTTGFRSLLAFGIEPTAGGLQALTDAGYKYGKGAEDVEGIIRGVGQAWSKGKLQQEEALQLLERGIPVWGLLSEKLGIAEGDLQKLATQGRLGRDAIQLLMDALANDSAGAAAQRMQSLSGATSNLRDSWTQAMSEIGDAAYDPAVLAVQQLGASIAILRDSGAIEAIGTTFSIVMSVAAVTIADVNRGVTELLKKLRGGGQTQLMGFLPDWLANPTNTIAGWDALIAKLREQNTTLSDAVSLGGDLASILLPTATSFGAKVKATAIDLANQAAWENALAEAMSEAAAEEKKKQTAIETEQRMQETIKRIHDQIAASMGQQAEKAAEKKAAAEAERAAQRDIKSIMDQQKFMAEITMDLQQKRIDEAMKAAQDEQDFMTNVVLKLEQERINLIKERSELEQEYMEEVTKKLEEEVKKHEWLIRTSWTRAFRDAIADGIQLGFEGSASSFGEFADQFTQGLSQRLSQNLSQQFEQGGFSGMAQWAEENRGQAVLGGAATIYQATQQQSRGAGALQGAMGGASMGLPWAVETGGWSVVVGAIVGGIAGYMASGSSDTPTTGARYTPQGGWDITSTSGHQYYGEERRERWEQSMHAVDLRLWQQYRQIAEQFGQADLMGMVTGMPSWATGGGGFGSAGNAPMEISADELARMLSDTIRPEQFYQAFREVFQTGLGRLGVSDAMFQALEDELASLPGQERLSYLADYVGTVVGLTNALTDLAGGAVTERAGRDPWDQFLLDTGTVFNQLDVLTSGWNTLDLASQIEQGQRVLELGQNWGDTMVEVQRGLIQMTEEVKAGIEGIREAIMLMGMTQEEQWGYASTALGDAIQRMRDAANPTELANAYQDATGYLSTLQQQYQSLIQYAQQLQQMTEAMRGQSASFQERIDTRGMDPGELAAYYRQQFAGATTSMATAGSAEELQGAWAQAMHALQVLEGLSWGQGIPAIPDDMLQEMLDRANRLMENGMRLFGQDADDAVVSMGEALGLFVDDLEEAWDITMGGFTDAVEALAQQLADALGVVLVELLGVGGGNGGGSTDWQRLGVAVDDTSVRLEELGKPGGDLELLGGKAISTGVNLEELGAAAVRLTAALDAAAAAAMNAASASGGTSSIHRGDLAAARAVRAQSQAVMFS